MSELRRVAIRVPRGEPEIARARLLALVPAGFEEVERGGALELVAYVDADAEALVRGAFGEVTSSPVEPGWEDRWRAFHRPAVAGGVWLGPPWLASPHGMSTVVVDPGRAFGTGAHPTTRACIELLADLERGSCLDAGCGSGVVAVAAVRLGFAPVSAVDLDPDAVEAARRTFHANEVRIALACGDVLQDELPPADVVVANIELSVVEALLARAPAPRAVTSGYLAHDSPSAPGWEREARLELEGWAADVLVAL